MTIPELIREATKSRSGFMERPQAIELEKLAVMLELGGIETDADLAKALARHMFREFSS